MPRKGVPPARKAQAIAALHAGEQPAVVAERFGIDAGTVRVWKTRYVTDSVTQQMDARPQHRPAVVAQQQQIGVLVLDLLAAKLKASAAIAQAASNPEWLAQQSGAELAALGAYLDDTVLAIGDRLAGGHARASDPAGDADRG